MRRFFRGRRRSGRIRPLGFERLELRVGAVGRRARKAAACAPEGTVFHIIGNDSGRHGASRPPRRTPSGRRRFGSHAKRVIPFPFKKPCELLGVFREEAVPRAKMHVVVPGWEDPVVPAVPPRKGGARTCAGSENLPDGPVRRELEEDCLRTGRGNIRRTRSTPPRTGHPRTWRTAGLVKDIPGAACRTRKSSWNLSGSSYGNPRNRARTRGTPGTPLFVSSVFVILFFFFQWFHFFSSPSSSFLESAALYYK